MDDPMDEMLKPCPFCGGKAHFLSRLRYRVKCSNCYATISGVGFWEKEEAAKTWNKRSDSPAREHAEEAIELLKTAKLLVWQNSEVGDAAKTEIENFLATIEVEEQKRRKDPDNG